MASLHFEWDDRKAEVNRRKHRVSFAEAQTVFFDEHGLFMGDPDHSQEEDRFLLLGLSESVRLLVVCHCYRRGEETIRIISARKANRSEEAQYRRRRRG
jgi:uncharacterized DUF497 family protein